MLTETLKTFACIKYVNCEITFLCFLQDFLSFFCFRCFTFCKTVNAFILLNLIHVEKADIRDILDISSNKGYVIFSKMRDYSESLLIMSDIRKKFLIIKINMIQGNLSIHYENSKRFRN